MQKFVIDGEKITSKNEFFDLAFRQLPLPDWCGRNLDALHDAITCDILPKEPLKIEILFPDAFREHLGAYADAVMGMLADIASEDRRFTLTINE